ncbi:hypothetical protein [Paracoccus sp. IB05]|uniref:ATP-binding cassette domain-containing protein n=1 Tax=Paracoccus sp. IB05 TaxID=2779367 RepID=UPI0018E7669D|nr:hypothetical protein [Paracoccus sp. IB05]MBJ2151472.1 hypothetical protein [Paracoccus sp. IB05]
MIYAKAPSGGFKIRHGDSRAVRASGAALTQAGFPPVEFRKVALPSQVQGRDPRLWPRLSFRLDQGERLVLFGDQPEIAAEVLRLIARQTAAMAGAVCLQGRDIWLMSGAEVRQKVALVDAGSLCDPAGRVGVSAGVSLWQTVSRALLPEGCDWGEVRDDRRRQDIAMALAKMGLLAQADQDCAGLDAAGQLALVMARALAMRPGVLLIDATRPDPAAAPALDLLAGLDDLAILVAAAPQQRSMTWATGWATGWLSPPDMLC